MATVIRSLRRSAGALCSVSPSPQPSRHRGPRPPDRWRPSVTACATSWSLRRSSMVWWSRWCLSCYPGDRVGARHVLPGHPGVGDGVATQPAHRPAYRPGLQICARYRPAGRDEVGGDWYDAFLRRPDQLAVVIGDVVGHDITAAGSALLFYTDGLVEHRRSALTDDLNALVTRAADAAHQLVEPLCDKLITEAPTDDDIAVLAIRLSGR